MAYDSGNVIQAVEGDVQEARGEADYERILRRLVATVNAAKMYVDVRESSEGDEFNATCEEMFHCLAEQVKATDELWAEMSIKEGDGPH
jgi:hypothetical protein